MKTIKIIDLINKIANGEDVPKKIKIDSKIYSTNSTNNICLMIYEKTGEMCDDNELKLFLNDLVEIIEEKKLPEKINVKGSYNSNKGFEDFNDNEKILVDKINDLLDYLKSKGDE